MNKFLKWALIVLGSLAAIAFIGFQVMKSQTKKASPEGTVAYERNGLKVDIYYNRPSKKGREIFGGLVPYDVVWRTGANEATTFSTNKDLNIGGQNLPAGKYTLWTIPGKNEWKVIFNKEMYGWGVDFDQKAQRKPEFDALQATIAPEILPEELEMFTISVDDAATPALVLAWDRTRVVVPMQ
ncbi:MAG: DUF2911 domain-containing protein [Flavobacteriales bacterium]|nr:DUF2911 domain-containing protein [Flavobacteriales bacterium]